MSQDPKPTPPKARRPHDPAKNRAYKISSYYGLTVEDYARLYAAQGGVCAICEGHETTIGKDGKPLPLSVDHDHASGAVRGLSCGACNRALGMFKDSPYLLSRAAAYLNKPRSTP